MKNLLSVILFISVLSSAFAAPPAKETPTHEIPAVYVQEDMVIKVGDNYVTLRAGTPIILEAIQTYTGKSLSTGQTINVRAKFDVVLKKQTLISAGAFGTAIVSKIQKPGIFGKPGKLEIQIQSVQAVDNQQVMLSGIPLTLEGQNKRGLAWGLSGGLFVLTGIGGVVGFFIKGKDAEFRAGSTITSNVASGMEIEIE